MGTYNGRAAKFREKPAARSKGKIAAGTSYEVGTKVRSTPKTKALAEPVALSTSKKKQAFWAGVGGD